MREWRHGAASPGQKPVAPLIRDADQAVARSAVEQRVLDAIDLGGMLDCLDEFVQVRSLSGEETPAQEFMAARFAKYGLDVDVWELDFDELRRHPAFSTEFDRTHGLGVVGALGGQAGGRSLIFNGHVDVVPVGDERAWYYPPWKGTRANGNVYGRGALDMKGGLCSALFAAKAIQDAGVRLAGRLLIESVIGEEDGGQGTLACLLRGHRAEAAVVVEPTQLVVAPAQAGALNFRLTVPGQSAHGCLRHEGVSAIERFFPLYQAIMALESERNQRLTDPLFADYRIPYPICIGTVRSGDWASSVPDWLTCEGRYGVAVGEDIAAARKELERIVDLTAKADPWLRDHPPRLEWWGGQFRPAGIDADHPLVKTVSGAFRSITGASPQVRGMPYGADMQLLVHEGRIPTVLFGPGDVRHAHRPDEFVPVSDLEAVVRTLALTALRWCGHE